jgi:single-stranded-DNA-specific exonuclease
VNRQYTDPEVVFNFLHPQMNQLRSPCGLKDMDVAVRRIEKAIIAQEKILIFGDYDVDGITSAAILSEFLQKAGADVSYYLPHRITEGYSLKPEHIDHIAIPGDVSLIITADCGSTSHDAIIRAKEADIDVVITDHHQVAESLPDAVAMVNPQRLDCDAGFNHLAGVGVAMALLICLRKHLRESGYWHDNNEPNLKELCDLVALGTIADAVPLIYENRIFVRAGLDVIRAGKSRAGISEILSTCQTIPRHVDSEDIAFKIAPRLNAAGRIDHANRAAELLLTTNRKTAKKIVVSLNGLNNQRKEAENAILKEIQRHLSDNPEELLRDSLILAGQDWHEGVLGIAAARLVTRYHKPVVLISTRSRIGKGSGRSIPQFNLYEALSTSCANQLVNFGGHSMAVGLSIHPGNIDRFKSIFDRYAHNILHGLDTSAEVLIDRELDFHEINGQLIDDIDSLKPFGNGNNEPMFMSRNVRVKKCQIVAERHRRMVLEQTEGTKKRSFSAIQFNVNAELNPPESFDRMAFRLQWNRWNGRKNIQLLVEETDEEEV